VIRTKVAVLVMAVAFLFLPTAWPQPRVRGTQTVSSASREITTMLNQFLRDAAKSDTASFSRFFADDVLYTRSGGAVVTRSELIKIVDAQRLQPSSSKTLSAEDITIHEYGDTAVASFRVVSVETRADRTPPTVTKYRNTGTFLRRNGRWQVIAWQSMRLPDDTSSNK
jgi:ketosteroid isomerase-like protein